MFFCALGVGLATLAVLPGALAPPASFSPNIRVNAVTTWDQRNASMAVGPGGTIHVVWEDYQVGMGPGVSAVYYAKSDNGGASFTVAIPIVNPLPTNVRQRFPSVAVSSNNWIHVVWTDLTGLGTPQGAGVYYARSKTGGTSFEPKVAVSDAAMDDGALFFVPRIAAYGSGVCHLHVIWAADDVANRLNSFTYDQSTNCGDTFGTDLLVDPAGYDAALDVAPDGTVGVAYAAGTSEQANIYFKMKVGALWQNRVQVSQPPSKYDRDPTVAFDPSAPPGVRTVHVAWADGRNVDPNDEGTFWNWDVFYSKAPDGANFGPNVRVSDVLGPPPARQFSEQSEPWIDVDAAGNPRIAWTDWRNDPDNGHRDAESPSQDADVYFDESLDGGVTFGTDQRVNDDIFQNMLENSRPMLIAVGAEIDVVWQDGRVPAYGLDVYFAGTNVPLGSSTGLKVNEVLFATVCPGEPWVEFYNKDPLHVNMRGMEWTDEDGFVYRFPSVMPMVPPGAYVVVHIKAGTDEAYFGQSQPNALHLYTGEPAWQRHSLGFLFSAGGVATGDFDRDEDIDIAAGEGYQDGNALYVYYRPADPTAAWPRTTVDSGWGNTWVLAAGDLDLDGNLDLLSGELKGDGPNRHLTWYENTQPGWVRHPIETDLTDVSDVAIADVDRDGYPDVVASFWGGRLATWPHIYWYKNDGTPRDGGWTRHTVSDDWGSGIAVADYDGDAKPDVFASRDWHNPDDDIGWYRNGPTEPWAYTVVRTFTHGDGHSSPPFLDAGDIEGDGDVDVASGATSGDGADTSIVSWYENRLDESPPGWTYHVVDTDSYAAGWWGGVELADVDRNGKPDIVVAQTEVNTVALFRNNLGGTPGWIKEVVDDSLIRPDEVSVAQIDGDCWWDVAATDNVGNALYWYTKRVLDGRDQVSLYTSSVHSASTLVDFVAWGGNAESDDDIARDAGQWPDGTYVDTAAILPDQTIGRDASSTDTNTPADWAIRTKTPGAPNA